MVRLYCDKCGVRIEDRYYTVAFTEHCVNKEHKKTDDLEKIAAYITCVKPTALEELSSQKMYCVNCKNELDCK